MKIDRRKAYMDLKIYHSQTESLLSGNQLEELLHGLPVSLHSRALRYRSETSSYNYVVGRLLLKHGLELYGIDSNLEKITFQEDGKPILSGINFNISHSDHRVICAFSKDASIGIDIEKIRPINFEDFTAMFSPLEWDRIKSADDPLRTFYRFWSRKESIIKALGRNLSYLHQIELDPSSDQFVDEGKRWYLRDVFIEHGFCAALCSEKQIDTIQVVEVSF